MHRLIITLVIVVILLMLLTGSKSSGSSGSSSGSSCGCNANCGCGSSCQCGDNCDCGEPKIPLIISKEGFIAVPIREVPIASDDDDVLVYADPWTYPAYGYLDYYDPYYPAYYGGGNLNIIQDTAYKEHM